VLADRVRVQGPDRHDTLTARHNLARRRGAAGGAAGAIAQLEAVLADHMRVLCEEHPHTLDVRSNLADWPEAGQGFARKRVAQLVSGCGFHGARRRARARDEGIQPYGVDWTKPPLAAPRKQSVTSGTLLYTTL
jgi:hypothetical protein